MRSFLWQVVSIFFLGAGVVQASDLEIFSSYEPLLIKQLGIIRAGVYDGGVYVSGGGFQGEYDLWFHLVSLRLKNKWSVTERNAQVVLETGLSATPATTRKEWIVPAMASDFTGTVSRPDGLDYAFNNQERYQVEDTFLAYVPVLVGLHKEFDLNHAVNIDMGINAGLYLFASQNAAL